MTILLIPLAIVLEQCLNAVTGASILNLAAMVIMPFLLNARRPLFGSDKVINATLVVIWIAIGISGAYFVVFGWILIYHTMLNRKGASFWVAVAVYFAVPICIFIGQSIPQIMEEGLIARPPQLFGHTYRLESRSASHEDPDYSTVKLLENGNRLILDGTDMGYMEFERADTGSSNWGIWHLIPNENAPLEECTIEVDRHFSPKISYISYDDQLRIWGNLYAVPDVRLELQTEQGSHTMVMEWYSARIIPENANALNSFTLTGPGSVSVHLKQKEADEPITKLTVMEEYHHAGQVDIRNYTLLRNEDGTFPLPEILTKRYDGYGQFAVYSISWDKGEYLFRINYE